MPFEAAVRPVDEGGADVGRDDRLQPTQRHVLQRARRLLAGILRDEWGFDGVVISDWFGTHSAAPSLWPALDLEMPGPARQRGDKLLAAFARAR